MGLPDAQKMKVGLIGLGVVGRAVHDLFADAGHEVVGWDRADGGVYPADELEQCEFCVICVDTPTRDGQADVSAVERAVSEVRCQRLLLKSTVPPGTTDRLAAEHGREICFWPEYVGQSSYHNPYFPKRIADVPFVVLGGEPSARTWFIDRLLPILGPTKQYFQCSAREAEIVKYTENAYFAVKITFVNEMRRLAEAFGADWHTVREGWLLDPRVEPMHTAAFSRSPGFGGGCLPKDLEALVGAAAESGYEARFLREVLAANNRFRSP
jgi:Predicted UDP-glucose 6-dehydrogenase